MQAKGEEVSALTERLRETSRVSASLRSEKRSLVEATDLLQNTNQQLKANLGTLLRVSACFSVVVCGCMCVCMCVSLLFASISARTES